MLSYVALILWIGFEKFVGEAVHYFLNYALRMAEDFALASPAQDVRVPGWGHGLLQVILDHVTQFYAHLHGIYRAVRNLHALAADPEDGQSIVQELNSCRAQS